MKTKKVLENNSDNSCNISDVSSCNITDSESDTGLTIVVNDQEEDKKPMKNKNKVTTEELKKVIEKSLASCDDEKPIKRKSTPRNQKRLLKIVILVQVVVMIKITKNQPNQ